MILVTFVGCIADHVGAHTHAHILYCTTTLRHATLNLVPSTDHTCGNQDTSLLSLICLMGICSKAVEVD